MAEKGRVPLSDFPRLGDVFESEDGTPYRVCEATIGLRLASLDGLRSIQGRRLRSVRAVLSGLHFVSHCEHPRLAPCLIPVTEEAIAAFERGQSIPKDGNREGVYCMVCLQEFLPEELPEAPSASGG